MRLRFSRRAIRDLAEIGDYIHERNPGGAVRVRAAILKTLQVLSHSPRAGRAQAVEGVRKIVVPRHTYIVYYSVNDAAQEVGIITILHAARQRPYSDL